MRIVVEPSTVPLPVPAGTVHGPEGRVSGRISDRCWSVLHDAMQNARIERRPADWKRNGTLWIGTKGGELEFRLFITSDKDTHVLLRSSEATYYDIGPLSDVPTWLQFEETGQPAK